MINVNELRIGNLVFIDYTESYYARVLELPDLRVEKSKNDKPLVSNSIVYPIPLAPEWLERCGYLKDSIDGKYYKQGSGLPPIYFIYNGYYYMDGLPLNGNKIKHLHQLQNLYFALTGEELNVKL